MNLILIKLGEHSLPSAADALDLPSNDERAKHITQHLNKKTGEAVSVGFISPRGSGFKGKATVHHLPNGGGVRLVPVQDTIVPSPDEPQITLVLAVPFPARLKYLWPVITSFSAVNRVVIVKARLSNAEFCESKALRPSVYEPMIENGMSQGCRTRPVRVDVRLGDDSISKASFKSLGLVGNGVDGEGVDDDDDAVARVFLDCGDEFSTPPPARNVVLEQCTKIHVSRNKMPSAVVAVGPERGWTDEEARIFAECGFNSAMLGSSILRVDTAVVSGLAIVSAALDECASIAAGGEERECKRKRQNNE